VRIEPWRLLEAYDLATARPRIAAAMNGDEDGRARHL
jgi:hypothetical protein